MSLWVCHCGVVTVGVSLWGCHCGVATVGVSLGFVTVGVSLWVCHYGCITVGVSLWVCNNGCVTVGVPTVSDLPVEGASDGQLGVSVFRAGGSGYMADIGAGEEREGNTEAPSSHAADPGAHLTTMT